MARRKKLTLEERVAARIRLLREEQGLSRAELARLAGTSGGYVGEVEAGAKVPTVSVAGKFAHALGVAPEDLVASEAPARRPDAADAVARQLRERGPEVVALMRNLIAGLDRAVAAAAERRRGSRRR